VTGFWLFCFSDECDTCHVWTSLSLQEDLGWRCELVRGRYELGVCHYQSGVLLTATQVPLGDYFPQYVLVNTDSDDLTPGAKET